MKDFAALFDKLDQTRKTSVKLAALRDYFGAASPSDAAWAVAFLSGRRGRRVVTQTVLKRWVAEMSGKPEWLVDECHDSVGDLAETLALLIGGDASAPSDRGLADLVETVLLPLTDLDEDERRRRITEVWREQGFTERLLFTKLLTGAFRVGVSTGLVVRALAELASVDKATMAHRLAGRFEPSAEAFRSLIASDPGRGDPLRPYPFLLAHQVPDDVTSIGNLDEFVVEWKWDGIRAQMLRRSDAWLIWSRGDEMVDHSFPELSDALQSLPVGTVLDGELLAWDPEHDRPAPFHALQRRLNRKTVGRKIQSEVPVAFLAYDALEVEGVDLRGEPLEVRRRSLECVVDGWQGAIVSEASSSPAPVRMAPLVELPGDASWDDLAELRAESRDRHVEGLMLKRRDAPYGAGRVRGSWWKWKVDPLTLDVVLVYAQRGHGRRASLYTDYTLAVRDGEELVPIAKAYSGLTDREILEVDRYIRRNITERFGPVRAVEPELVFEIAFEGIQPSPRHKAGLALRFPRIHRWRQDKRPKDADTIETARALLAATTDEGAG